MSTMIEVLGVKNAEKIVLVQDNLSTHKPASLYEAFPPAEARRLAQRFEEKRPAPVDDCAICWSIVRSHGHANRDWLFSTSFAACQ
jgi:hypothetical protein